jgi:hypothetical protein
MSYNSVHFVGIVKFMSEFKEMCVFIIIDTV